MNGPAIFARSLEKLAIADQFGNHWQYHSRSDRHSKIACWAMLFDLLQHCPLLGRHAVLGKVGFGVNHEFVNFATNSKKKLDLVICTPGVVSPNPNSFADLAEQFEVELTHAERTTLNSLPQLMEVGVGTVHVALEAKACMTAHVKARPRLKDELNSSHLAIHGAAEYAIAAGFTVINCSDEFISTEKNRHAVADKPFTVTKHRQPKDTLRVIERIQDIPRRSGPGTVGFDAIGIVVVDFKNDRSEVRLIETPPAPPPGDLFHYDQMIRRIAGSYAAKFGNT